MSASFDYHRALRFEDEFDVALRIEEITAKAIRYACEITQAADKIATGSLTIVCVRRRAGEELKAIEIPSDVLRRLTR